jgi:DNA mismatch repair ATPase MutS
MKVFLLYPDSDFDRDEPLPPNAEELSEDLGLGILLSAMADGDEFIFEVCRKVVFKGLQDMDTIHYRQEILRDWMAHPEVLRKIYGLCLEFLERKHREWLWISRRQTSPGIVLSNARRLLEASTELLRDLKNLAVIHRPGFRSRGLGRFLDMVEEELEEQYLAKVEEHLEELRFSKGVRLSAELGKGGEGSNYSLCKHKRENTGLVKRILAKRSPVYTFSLHPRDEQGARVLEELRDTGLAKAARALGKAAEHIESFFNLLRWELAFYVGCLNLSEKIREIGAPITFPRPWPQKEHRFRCKGLYNVTLALVTRQRPVGNELMGDGKDLFLITGPNQGGKTTFLRSVGLAQMMMQAGMFVPAEEFESNLCSGIFTHFRREEDRSMERGKLEEELERMRAIVESIKPGGLLLLNESFASTNEREGSEIALEVIPAVLDCGIKVFYVTHFFEFPQKMAQMIPKRILSLRAERLPDGTRTFKIKEGKPLETSYGVDLYRKIFGDRPEKETPSV